MRFLVGGYSAGMGGRASGIGMLLAGAADDASAGGTLAFAGEVASADSPSWIAPHPTLGVVYAALESQGTVQAFRRAGDSSWVPLGAAVPAGEAVCHLAVVPDGGSLVASCWGDGRVVRMTMDAAGRPSSPVIAPAAADPYGAEGASSSRPGVRAGLDLLVGASGIDFASEAAGGDLSASAGLAGGRVLDLAAAARALREAAGSEFAHLVPEYDEPGADVDDAAVVDAASAAGSSRERAEDAASGIRRSRAHQALFVPGGLVATTDLGLDLVRFWRVIGGRLRAVQDVVLPRGCGPRHLVWHPSGHLYVVTEFSCEIFVLAPSPDATWRLVGGTPLGAGTLPGDAVAGIALSRDAEFVYAGVRGSNTIATLRVRGAGELVEPVALVDAGVDGPRDHIVVRDILLVAGQHSDEVVSLTLDVRAGVPGRVRHRAAVPSPSCLVPLR